MDELEQAQAMLKTKRLELGLQEDGTRPRTTFSVGEVLKQVLTNRTAPAEDGGSLASTIFRNREACIRVCEDCGRTLEPVEWGEALRETLYAPRECPDCSPKREVEQAERIAKQERDRRMERFKGAFPLVTQELRAKTLAEFETRRGSEAVVRAVQQYVDGLPKPNPSGLLIHGDPGNGKSNLAAIITIAARKQGMAVAYIPAYDWFRHIGSLEPDQREALIDLASAADLVVMDDLGARRPTPGQSEWLLSIVDAVYRRKGCLVVTTNHAPDDLADALTPTPQTRDEPKFLAGARIVDRLAEIAAFVANRSTSYRLELAQRRLQGDSRAESAG